MKTISNCKRKTQDSGRLILQFPILGTFIHLILKYNFPPVLHAFIVQGDTVYICRTAYGKIHDIGKTQLLALIKMQQSGAESADPELSDTTNYGTQMRKKIENFVETHNLNFSRAQIAAIQIPARSEVFKEMVFWMDNYFATCGEFMPDKGSLRISKNPSPYSFILNHTHIIF